MPARVILLVATVLGFAASAFAQQTSAPSDRPVVVLVGGQYGTPTEWLGTAHRTAGPPGPKATIFTWSVGVQLPLGW